MSDTPILRLLLLEDSPADVELCLRTLQAGGLQVSAEVVVTPEEFARALAGAPDIVLADYHLPGWDCLKALDLIQARGLDLPVLVVSGQIGEEAAAECVRRGAADYVLKDRLGRLCLAVRRVVEERRLRAGHAQAERSLREVEARCRQLVDRSLAGIFRLALDGRVLDCNAALARMLGFDSVEALLAHPPREFYGSPGERAALRAELGREGSISNREICLKKRDGTPVWALANATLIGGAAPTIEATLIDITDRKRAERKILELNRLYAVVSHLDQAIVRIQDRQRLLEEICRIAVEDGGFRMAWFGLVDAGGAVRPAAWYGFEEGYLQSLSMSVQQEAAGPTGSALREGRYFVANDIAQAPALLPWREQALRRGYLSSAAFPVPVQGRLAGVLTLYATTAGFFDDANIELLQQMAADLGFALESMERDAQRKRAEYERARLFASEQAARAQAHAEARYRRLLEAAPDAILEVDRAGRILLLNPATERLFGYTREQLLGQPLELLVPESTRAAHAAHRAEFWATPAAAGMPSGREVRARRQDGSEFPVEVSLSPVRTGEGETVTCIVRDITHRKHAEEALRESNRQVVSILERITDAFFALDGDWRFTYLNSRAEQIVGRRREDLLGRSLWERFPGLAGTPFETQYHQAVKLQQPAEFSAHDPITGLWTEVHAYPSATGLSVYLHDITARKQLEEHSQQSQKLEALGRLAGGVAHDFNNLLTIIGGYSQMALESLDPRLPTRKDLEAVVEAANRASMLTRQLLAFSRRQHVQPRVLELNKLVKRMNRILRRLIGEDVEIVLDLQPDLGRIKADPGQLEQVIVNLTLNARDAMPHGGTISIRAANFEVAGERHGIQPELHPGSYVVLSFSDTGVGMDPETRSRVFEPFFTTKPRGKGTGLGLSTVYGVVKQSGGDIEVESAPGQGTAFRIYLPRVLDEPKSARRQARRAPGRGSETILLVEDEPEVRKLAREMLLKQGYHVLDAPGGAEALRLVQQRGQPIDLLLTDVIMPHMSGRDLADRLKTLQPDLKVLYVSGYSDEILSRHGVLEAKTELLPKPFTREALGARVRRVLDGPPKPPAQT